MLEDGMALHITATGSGVAADTLEAIGTNLLPVCQKGSVSLALDLASRRVLRRDVYGRYLAVVELVHRAKVFGLCASGQILGDNSGVHVVVCVV